MSFKNVHYGKNRIRRSYSHVQTDVELPNLVEIQTKSFAWFKTTGIRDLFREFSPIKDHSGKFQVWLGGLDGTKYEFLPPKASIAECKRNSTHYAQDLQAEVILQNNETGELFPKNMFLGSFPIMTPTGTFVINGAERVIVTQIIRSAGVFFESEIDKSTGETLWNGKVIPTRGAWIEYLCGKKGVWYAKLDRSKKIPLTTFLRALGIEKYSLFTETFGAHKNFASTMAKDDSLGADDALSRFIYPAIRPGEQTPAPEMVREYIRTRIFANKHYDLAQVGRFKMNQKLDIFERIDAVGIERCSIERPDVDLVDPEDPKRVIIASKAHAGDKDVQLTEEIIAFFRHKNEEGEYDHRDLPAFPLLHTMHIESSLLESDVRTERLRVYVQDKENPNVKNEFILIGNDQNETSMIITEGDIIASISYFINLNQGIGKTDDIDHLGNRRLRLTGELLQFYFRQGLTKLEKHITEKMSIFPSTQIAHVEGAPEAPKMPALENLINTRTLTSSIKEFFSGSTLSQFMDQINPLSELTHKRRISALGAGGLSRDRAGAEVRDVHATHYGRICPIETPEGQNIGLINSLATYARVNPYGFIETPYLTIHHFLDSQGLDHAYQVQNERKSVSIEASGTKKEVWVPKERVYLSADKEDKYYVAQGNTTIGLFVLLRPNETAVLNAALSEQILSAPLVACPEEDKHIKWSLPDNDNVVTLKITSASAVDKADASSASITAQRLGSARLIAKAGPLAISVNIIVLPDSATTKAVFKEALTPIETRFGDEYYEFSLSGTLAKIITDERVYARFKGETIELKNENNGLKDVSYMDVAPKQIVAVSPSCIPFLEHCDAKRILMGSNMQRQAIPLLKPEAAFVATGIEEKAGIDSGVAVRAPEDGTIEYADALKIIMRGASGKLYTFDLLKYGRSNDATCINQRPIVVNGEEVKKGAVLADGQSMDEGEMALGRNVTIAIMTWQGYNYEDAVIMSERLVQDDVYTSIHIQRHEVSCRDTKLGPEVITRDVPDESDAKKNKLDEDGIVRIGTEVHEGDILVGKTTPKGTTESTPEERLAATLFFDKSHDVKNTSLRVPHGAGGIVHRVERFKRGEEGIDLPAGVRESIRVYIVQKRKITVGDKMSGRYGNKGVISRILPQEDMPYIGGYYRLDEKGNPIIENGDKVVDRTAGLDGRGMESGMPVDIMLNPQGIPSRMNIGQVLEAHLGMAAHMIGERITQAQLAHEKKVDISKMQTRNGIHVATPVFDGATVEDVQEIMAEAGMRPDGKVILIDGRTGKPFDHPINVGIMYMIKLAHMVDDKLHARAEGPYTLITQQPMGGKAQNGGQRFGEMEVWALEAYGAAYTLREMLTVKSDDMIGRNKMYKALVDGTEIPDPGIPEAFRVLVKELQGLGLSVKLINQNGVDEANKSLVQELMASVKDRPDKHRLPRHQNDDSVEQLAATVTSADSLQSETKQD